MSSTSSCHEVSAVHTAAQRLPAGSRKVTNACRVLSTRPSCPAESIIDKAEPRLINNEHLAAQTEGSHRRRCRRPLDRRRSQVTAHGQQQSCQHCLDCLPVALTFELCDATR